MEVNEFWNFFLDILNNKLNVVSFTTWFKDTKLISLTDDEIIINVGSIYKKNMINNFYSDLIEEVIEEILNKTLPFKLVTDDEIKENKKEKVIKDKINNEKNEYKETNNNLISKYTFENFIVGDSNRLAQTVALSVAEQPGMLYNPLFIYGNSGLGKTHLMHAIGNYIIDNSDKQVLYVTSDTFISDFTQINKKGENNLDIIEHFKDKYRNIDVLIIDDIQMLKGANKTQDEFFNTFNFLHGKGKQIIISSDSSPDDLKFLEDRLKTRFTWGLPVNITPPDLDLKIRILKNKISGQEVGALIKPEVLEYIANNCESDVRHLEGAINRLYAVTSIYRPKEINLEFANENLKDYFGSSIYITNNIGKVQKAVADYFDITVDNLKSANRKKEVNLARQIAMYICKMTTEETLEKIGLEFNRNHATVIHACDKIDEDLKNDEDLKRQIKEIKEKIAN